MLSKAIILGIIKFGPDWNSLSRGGNSHLYSSRVGSNTKKYFDVIKVGLYNRNRVQIL